MGIESAYFEEIFAALSNPGSSAARGVDSDFCVRYQTRITKGRAVSNPRQAALPDSSIGGKRCSTIGQFGMPFAGRDSEQKWRCVRQYDGESLAGAPGNRRVESLCDRGVTAALAEDRIKANHGDQLSSGVT